MTHPTEETLPEGFEKRFDRLKYELKEEDSWKGKVPDHVMKKFISQELATAVRQAREEGILRGVNDTLMVVQDEGGLAGKSRTHFFRKLVDQYEKWELLYHPTPSQEKI
jgi:hypothetical protein